MENGASSSTSANERSEINYIETSIIATDFKMGSQTLCNLFHWAHAGLDHCNHRKKKQYEEWVYLVLFTFADLIQKNVKSVRLIRPSCMWTIVCYMSFSHLQHTKGQECLSSWEVVLGTLHSRSGECSCQKDFTSQMSTYLWLEFTSPIAPCLRTMLLKTKILFSQKEGKEWAPKISTAHSSETLNKPS